MDLEQIQKLRKQYEQKLNNFIEYKKSPLIRKQIEAQLPKNDYSQQILINKSKILAETYKLKQDVSDRVSSETNFSEHSLNEETHQRLPPDIYLKASQINQLQKSQKSPIQIKYELESNSSSPSIQDVVFKPSPKKNLTQVSRELNESQTQTESQKVQKALQKSELSYFKPIKPKSTSSKDLEVEELRQSLLKSQSVKQIESSPKLDLQKVIQKSIVRSQRCNQLQEKLNEAEIDFKKAALKSFKRSLVDYEGVIESLSDVGQRALQ